MVSGRPLHPEEEKYIQDHRHDFPSVTARSLGCYFSHLNGGYRTAQTVRDYLKKLEDLERMETPHVRILEADLSTPPAKPASSAPKKKKAVTKKNKTPDNARATPAT